MTSEETMRSDVRKKQLEILIKLDEVCSETGLRYYLAFGTCLGALRHKGFIPWDDDIDVLMPYEDVKKLITMQSRFGNELFIQSKETDPDYRSIAARIRNSNTTCIESDEVDLKTNKGIYIDIYPYYECSDNTIIRTIDILRSHLFKILVNNRPPVNHGKMAGMISKIILSLYPEKRRQKKIDQIEKRLASVRGSKILDYYGQDISFFSAITYPKEWFDKPRKLEFAGKLFNGPTEPELYMTRRYGDYMQLPPIEDQVVHHTYITIDPYRSYLEYEMEKGKE